ncbi:MAG: hypothetical protein R2725_07795 [Solirubrobacterales bacterium]
MQVSDTDLSEVNEAFASVLAAERRELDPESGSVRPSSIHMRRSF